MAAALSFLLLLLLSLHLGLLFTLAASQTNSTTSILPGASLSPATQNNSYWLSPSGLYAFGFYQRDGGGYSVGVFMAGIPDKTVVWTARRDDPPVPSNSTLSFTVDGRLVLLQPLQPQGTVIATPSETAVSASMLDSGNFVLYNSGKNVTWQSFDNPTDTLVEGQNLSNGNQLYSAASDADPSTGIFRIIMQSDGNLVMYPAIADVTPSLAYWSSHTFTSGPTVTLNLASDGLLYLVNGTGQYLTNISSTGRVSASEVIYRARMDPDGIFRLYSYNVTQRGNWLTVWSSTSDKCDPIGLCGLNGYCINDDQVASCECLPGFDFVKTRNQTSGCERIFVAQSCKAAAAAASSPAGYNISVVPNTVWEDDPYSVVTVRSDSECQAECLQDCNCEAAIYQGGSCRKQRLPLRYGRRNLGSSDALYVKVGQTTVTMIGPPNDTGRPEERIRKDVLAVSLSFLAVALVIIVVCGILLYKYHVRSYRTIPTDAIIEDVAPRSFTYDELAKVTRNFVEEVGKGAFGTVYRGTLPNRQAVAVKKLERVSTTEGEREFQTEMKIIGRTHHRNLVRLLGYSLDGPNRLLVYEYMSNGSLADLLFNTEKNMRHLISWGEKMGIVRNIARGLLYLHEECETQIIHCDIKPENILIDEDRRAKISDFGLSKLLKPDQTNTFTRIRGTRGYVAPEWHKNLPVTTKADVYSFGVVLLEIVCSRRNVDQSLPEEEMILEHWVYDCFQAGELERLIGNDEEDEGAGAVDMRQLERMVKVGIWCTLEEPSLRPSMRKVLLMLEGTVDIPSPPSPTSFISCI